MSFNRFIIPVILLVASLGLFFGFISKEFKEKTRLAGEVLVYKDALEKANQLKAKQDELDKKRLSIGAANLENLEKLLPDNVDTVRMIMNLNGIASHYNITLKSVKINEEKPTSTPTQVVAAPNGSPGESKVESEYGSTGISFDVVTSYDKFESFLTDLEKSLQILDVTKISLKPAEVAGSYNFSVSARTYWLR